MSRLFVWHFLVPAGILSILGIPVSSSQGPASFAVYRSAARTPLSRARCFILLSTNPLFSRGSKARFSCRPGDFFGIPLLIIAYMSAPHRLLRTCWGIRCMVRGLKNPWVAGYAVSLHPSGLDKSKSFRHRRPRAKDPSETLYALSQTQPI